MAAAIRAIGRGRRCGSAVPVPAGQADAGYFRTGAKYYGEVAIADDGEPGTQSRVRTSVHGGLARTTDAMTCLKSPCEARVAITHRVVYDLASPGKVETV